MPQSQLHKRAVDMLFREEQRFTQWFIWLLLLGLLAVPLYGIIQQIILKDTFGSKPMSDTGLIFFFMGTLGFCYFFWSIRLVTTVNQEYIHIRFLPLVNKKILWADVKQVEIVTYNPLIGYGVRIWTPHGTVYNVKGRKGLFLLLKDGKKLMIGTQRCRELEQVAQAVLKSV